MLLLICAHWPEGTFIPPFLEGSMSWAWIQAEWYESDDVQAADDVAEEDGDLFGDAKSRSDGGGPPPAAADAHQDTNALLDQFFGRDEDLAEDDLFLKRFISKKVSCWGNWCRDGTASL